MKIGIATIRAGVKVLIKEYGGSTEYWNESSIRLYLHLEIFRCERRL